MNEEKGSFKNMIRSGLKGLNLIRIILLNFIFFLILFWVVSFFLKDYRPTVPYSTVLILKPEGNILEESSLPDFFTPAHELTGTYQTGCVLKDIIDAIESGRNDTRVRVLLLDLSEMGSAGLSKLQEIGNAIERFKKSGKKIIAFSDSYTRDSYYLASKANEIYMHPMGQVLIEGYSRYAWFYKEGLDKLGIEVNVFRVGKYKSAVEPYLRNNMSDEAKEANLRYLSVLWDSYVKDIALSRKVTPEAITLYIDRFVDLIKEANGDGGTVAKEKKLIDGTLYSDELSTRLIDLAGEDPNTHSYSGINYLDYLESLTEDRWGDNQSGDVVGVIIASGTILDGYQSPGSIGGDSTAELIRKARLEPNVKAIVLKVDSPGGSSFASEVIRRELEIAQKDGKKVVISMGSVAASGGYWISMASDEVWANPTTITGSIGIFGLFPTFYKPMANYLGIHVDGVQTNKMAGIGRPDRPISPEVAEGIQSIIDKGYNRFITLVAKARKKTPEQIDQIAQGRVWIGSDAFKLGLVDKMGFFSDALDSAANLAKLGKRYNVKYFRQTPSFKQQLMARFFSQSNQSLDHSISHTTTPGSVSSIIRMLMEQYKRVFALNDPNGVYALCMDAVDFQ